MHPYAIGHRLSKLVFVGILGLALLVMLIFMRPLKLRARERFEGTVIQSFPKAAIVDLTNLKVRVHIVTMQQHELGESISVWRERAQDGSESYSEVID